MTDYTIHQGDCRDVLATLPAESVQCVVTSPPYYGLRDYGVDGQIGLEQTPDEYVAQLVAVFREVRRVLRADGTVWLNLGDSYAGSSATGGTNSIQGNHRRVAAMHSSAPSVPDGLKPKDIIGIPWRVAFALQADGWWLRQDIIWHKPNPMPESVTDRCTKAHEYVFLLTKAARYYYDAEAVAEAAMPEHAARYKYDFWPDGTKEANGGGRPNGAANTSGSKSFSGTRNRRSVWTITTKPYSGAHFATMPSGLAEVCIRAGSKPGDVVLDPFNGSGTTGAVAVSLGRQYVGIELNPDYIELAHQRIQAAPLPLIAEAL